MTVDADDEVNVEERDPDEGRLELLPLWSTPAGRLATRLGVEVDLDSEIEDQHGHELARSTVVISTPQDLEGETFELLEAKLRAEQPRAFRLSGWLRNTYPVRLQGNRYEPADLPIRFEHHSVYGFRPIDDEEAE